MKNAIITAATKGMGRAIAIAFAKEGVNLAICSRSGDDLSAFKSELAGINPNIKVFTSTAALSNKYWILPKALKRNWVLSVSSLTMSAFTHGRASWTMRKTRFKKM